MNSREDKLIIIKAYADRSESPRNRYIDALDAKPEQHLREHGYPVLHPNGSGFLIANRSGAWRSADDSYVDSALLTNIGLALEGH